MLGGVVAHHPSDLRALDDLQAHPGAVGGRHDLPGPFELLFGPPPGRGPLAVALVRGLDMRVLRYDGKSDNMALVTGDRRSGAQCLGGVGGRVPQNSTAGRCPV